MKRYTFSLILSFFTGYVFTQNITEIVIDSLYKEDQFYIGTTYNLFNNQPKDLRQNSFSLGFHLGFIKDIPVNKKRNKAIGIGLGYSTNSYIQNMLISNDTSGNLTYTILDGSINFSKNKFSDHVVELPIEYRWRTSTIKNHKFWRIYTGIKFGYVLANRSKFRGDLGQITINNIEDYSKFQYGLTLSFGYNTWNIYGYYGLNPLFSNAAFKDNESLDLNAIKLGLMFYIL